MLLSAESLYYPSLLTHVNDKDKDGISQRHFQLRTYANEQHKSKVNSHKRGHLSLAYNYKVITARITHGHPRQLAVGSRSSA